MATVKAEVQVVPEIIVAPVHRALFGAFVEQMGRGVYGGLYDPAHPTADAHGFRRDVIDLVRELGVTTVRYPGGNFVSGFRWEDSVGPRAARPRRLDLAWGAVETNEFGLHEFIDWTQASHTSPMLAINLGTRGIEPALDLVEYCNVSAGTQLSEQRRANGADDPFAVQMWCLGNEMDGYWQVGAKTPQEYGRLAAEVARAVRMIEPSLTLVACGSSATSIETFPLWERIVLEEAYEQIDLISAHAYYEQFDDDLGSFLASSVDMIHQIETVVATADYVQALKRSPKRMNISFDEWNVWYQQKGSQRDWTAGAGRLEETYNVADAVVVGSMLIALLRHSDRVVAASLAQLVNVIAPIRADPAGPAWRQTTFHPFAQAASATGSVVRIDLISPSISTQRHGDVDALDAAATWDEQAGTGVLFVVNRSPSDEIMLEVDFRNCSLGRVTATVLTSGDPYLTPTAATAANFAPVPWPVEATGTGRLLLTLPPVAWAVVKVWRAA